MIPLIITAASLSALGFMLWKVWKLPVEGGEPCSDFEESE